MEPDPAEAAAEASRARAQSRSAYLLARGNALRAAGRRDDEIAMWAAVLRDDDAYAYERAAALEQLAGLFVAEDPEGAEECYRMLLRDHPSLGGTTRTAELALAELLLDRGGHEAADEAEDLLAAWLRRGRAQLPDVMFRWHLALIRVADARGDADTRRHAAQTALRLAASGPVIAHRPRAGVVRTDAATLALLRRLASAEGS